MCVLLRDYCLIYLTTEVILLADEFEHLRNSTLLHEVSIISMGRNDANGRCAGRPNICYEQSSYDSDADSIMI